MYNDIFFLDLSRKRLIFENDGIGKHCHLSTKLMRSLPALVIVAPCFGNEGFVCTGCALRASRDLGHLGRARPCDQRAVSIAPHTIRPILVLLVRSRSISGRGCFVEFICNNVVDGR